ncbi:epoxide hydrolase family protein [Luteipulveratus flavus]|uniref:Epoxide hydrolase n=1 Tax=Luteipulveratus flavus TaxID=3031728 RepID=A0ABT6C1M1_9MICO|nr:epoxide hydrolase family protein [Luteipulveratus sp. YIM 133296]MDF8262657.1 epoxide hydrolase [Luteipulveratus sp. YIM 133296]
MAQDFTIDVPQQVIDDLRTRLRATRWPDAIGDDWERGTPPDALRRLVDHWAGSFDWAARQEELNQLDHQRVEVDGIGLHVVRAGRTGATPLLLVHGWPDSFLRFERLIPLLADDFELVVPSLPGYGFSDRPTEPGTDGPRIAELFAGLMTELGHERFGYHGGDLGSGVGEALAAAHGDRMIGLHLTDVPYWHLFAADPSTLSEEEQDYLQRGMQWSQSEGSYALQQSTKPQTIAYALNDSPAGLAAWFLEKYQTWSDCDGDVFSRFDPDWLATNLTVYWATQTAGSAARLYFENMRGMGNRSQDKVTVPTAFAIFPKDIVPAPRTFGERWFDVRRWTEMPRGGHFAAYEEPQLLADDIRAFFGEVAER